MSRVSFLLPSDPPQYHAETPGFIQSMSLMAVGGQRFSAMVVSNTVAREPVTAMRQGERNGREHTIWCALSSLKSLVCPVQTKENSPASFSALVREVQNAPLLLASEMSI